MQPLAQTYTKNSYNFALVNRIKDVAIYSQSLPESGKCIGYEVFEVQKFPERIMAGNTIAAKEGTPSNEQLGRLGFTIHDLKDAKAKMDVLLSNMEKRQNIPTI